MPQARRFDIHPFMLALCIAILCACSTPGRPLPPGTIEASSTPLPNWTGGNPGELCPSGQRCVVGQFTDATSKAQALESARTNAYLQLAQQAFPVQLIQRYQSERTSDDVQVSEALQAEVLGHLTGANNLEQAWIQRIRHEVNGSYPVYDGWALVAIDSHTLQGLYQKEIQRTKTEVSTMSNSLQKLSRQAEIDPPHLLSAMTELEAMRQRLPKLQPIPETERLARDIQTKQNHFMQQLQIRQISTERKGETNNLKLSVNFNKQALPSFPLSIQSDCLPNDLKQTTSPSGEVQIAVQAPSYFQGCTVHLQSELLPPWSQELLIKPAFSCLQVNLIPKLDGWNGNSLNRKIKQKKDQLTEPLLNRAAACQSSSKTGLQVILTLAGELSKPRRVGGKVQQCSGQATLQVTIADSTGKMLQQQSRSVRIQALGLNSKQIVNNAAENFMKQLAPILREWADGL